MSIGPLLHSSTAEVVQAQAGEDHKLGCQILVLVGVLHHQFNLACRCAHNWSMWS